MAVFNPEINPINPPNFLGYSKGIEQPAANTSMATAIKGVSVGLEAGVKATDQIIKSQIDQDVYRQVDAERNAFTTALSQTYNNNTAPSGTEVPAPVDKAISTAQSFQSAYTNGKIDKTYYDMRMADVQKNIRNQYPGYRDYIDAKVSSIVGGDPANQLVSAYISSINDKRNEAKSQAKEDFKMFESNADVPGIDKIMNAYYSGQPNAPSRFDVLKFISNYKQQKESLQYRNLVRGDFKGSREVKAAMTEDDAQYEAGITMSNYFDTIKISSGLNTPAKLADIIHKQQTGELPIDETQARQIGQAVKDQARVARAKVWSDWQKAGREGPIGILGAKKAAEILDSHMVLWNDIGDSIYNKDFGAAFSSANFISSRVNDATKGLMQNTDVGQYATMLQVIRKMGGDQIFQSTIAKDLLGSDVPDQFKSYTQTQILKMITQPDLRKDGTKHTLIDAVQEGKRAGIKFPSTYDQYLGLARRLDDPKTSPEIQAGIVDAFFDPKNQGLLAQFKKDYKDPQTGKSVAGKYSVFNRLTAPNVTSAVEKLSKMPGGEESLKNYTTWAKESFGYDLFSNELSDLSAIQKQPGMLIGWDPDKKQIIFKPSSSMTAGTQNMSYDEAIKQKTAGYQILSAKDTVDRLNGSLSNLRRVAEANGEDADVWLLSYLQDFGVDPNQMNIPGILMHSLIASRTAQQNKKTP